MEDKHVDDEGYDIEDQDIAIEVKDFEGVDIDLAGEEFQLIGIDDPNPILRIGDKIFEGVWGEFCVSGVVFDTEIQHQGTMTKKLIFNRVLVKSKSGENKPLPESGIDTSVILSAMHKAKNTEIVRETKNTATAALEENMSKPPVEIPVYKNNEEIGKAPPPPAPN